MGKKVSLDNILFPEFGGKQSKVLVASEFDELFDKIGDFVVKKIDSGEEVACKGFLIDDIVHGIDCDCNCDCNCLENILFCADNNEDFSDEDAFLEVSEIRLSFSPIPSPSPSPSPPPTPTNSDNPLTELFSSS